MDILAENLATVLEKKVKATPKQIEEVVGLVKIFNPKDCFELLCLLQKEPGLIDDIVEYFKSMISRRMLPPPWLTTEEAVELLPEALSGAIGRVEFIRWIYWIVGNDDIGLAREAFPVLKEVLVKKGINKDDPFYQRQFWRLAWVSIHFQSSTEADGLLRHAFLWGLRDDLPVRERLDLCISLDATFHQFHDLKREDYIRLVAQNEERLGESLRVSGETVDAAPTIANWLRDFARSNQSDKPRGPVEEINYLEHNANVKKLSPEDRQILLAVLGIYDELLFKDAEPPLLKQLRKEREREKQVVTSRPPAFVTPVGATRQSDSQRLSSRPASRERRGRDLRPGILTSSRLSVTPQDDSSHKIVMKVDTLQDTFAKFQKEQAEVTAQMAVILAKAGIHNDKKSADVVNILREAVATGNRLRALASLQALGAGVTPQVSADQATVAELYNYLERKMGHSAAMAYKMNPVRPVWVGWYWRYILVDQLKMNEDEAMLWVVSLGSQLGGEYKKLVYLDQATKQLKWNELV